MKKLYRCPVKGESPLNFIKAKTLYIETETEYDSPEFLILYFFVKDGVAIELYEEEGELFVTENGQKFR